MHLIMPTSMAQQRRRMKLVQGSWNFLFHESKPRLTVLLWTTKHIHIYYIYCVLCWEKKENSCVWLPPVTSKHLWLLVEAPTAWCTALRMAQEPSTSVIRHYKRWCYLLNHTAGRNGDTSNGCLGWHVIQSRWTMQWWRHRDKKKETVNYIPTALSGYFTRLSDRTHSAFCCECCAVESWYWGILKQAQADKRSQVCRLSKNHWKSALQY